MPEAFRIYQPEHPRVPTTVREQLAALKQHYINQLQFASDHDDFNRRVGVINGIEESIVVCKLAEEKLRG